MINILGVTDASQLIAYCDGYKSPIYYCESILHTFYASWHNGREFNEGREGMKHTYTPWFVHDFTELFGDDPRQVTVSCSHPDTITICSMDRGLTADIGEAKANARHIVHCVNNHKKLVEMLDSIVFADSPDNEWERIKQARALLSALEAEKGGEL